MNRRKHTALRVAFLTLLCGLSVFQVVEVRAQGVGAGAAAGIEKKCEDPMIANCRGKNEIFLMQPLDDETKTLPVSSEPLEIFFTYFNMSWPWLLGVASGIAVLQAVWGGILIMTSMDNEGGKEKIQWALGGMVMIALAGFILRFLNPTFYG